jgi:hypothetical protein
MERIDREVERTLSRSGSAPALELGRIAAAWPQIVGETVARNAWPLRIGRDGTLHVATSSATWAFELDRLSPELESRLAATLGDSAPRSLRFRVGPIPEPGRPPATPGDSRPSVPTEAPEHAAEAASAAAEIEDPELRELVRRAALASLARGSSGRAF